MADTKRTQTAILALLADNNSKNISPQDMRDAVVSMRANQGGGWLFYSNTLYSTEGAPQSITASTRTKILMDGTGTFTSTDQAQDLGSVLVSNSFFPTLDCAYILRLTFRCKTPSGGQSNYFDLELDIGAGGLGTGPVIWGSTEVLVKGANITHAVQYSIPLFAKPPFPSNGGSFWVTPSVDLSIWDARLFVSRIYQPDN